MEWLLCFGVLFDRAEVLTCLARLVGGSSWARERERMDETARGGFGRIFRHFSILHHSVKFHPQRISHRSPSRRAQIPIRNQILVNVEEWVPMCLTGRDGVPRLCHEQPLSFPEGLEYAGHYSACALPHVSNMSPSNGALVELRGRQTHGPLCRDDKRSGNADRHGREKQWRRQGGRRIIQFIRGMLAPLHHPALLACSLGIHRKMLGRIKPWGW